MQKKPTMLFVAAAALIDEKDQVLLQKRPENKQMAGLWEFPGGKVEVGESVAGALARELLEELDILVDVADLRPLTFATGDVGDRNLLLLLYCCHRWQGEPRAMESPELAWVSPLDMYEWPMPPADEPFIAALNDYLAKRTA